MTISMLIDEIVFSPQLPDDKRPKIEDSAPESGLKVTSPMTGFTGMLTVGGNTGIGTTDVPGEKLEVAGNIKITGDSIKNFQGLSVIETNKSDWLRINPDQSYPLIALYKSVAIGTGGLAIGEWAQLAQGQLKVTSSAYLATNEGNVGIGTMTPQSKLEVNGDMIASSYRGNGATLNNIVAIAGNEYMLRATFDSKGKVIAGTVLTVTHPNTGLYDINFNASFSDVPTVVVTQIFPGGASEGGDTRDNAVVVFVTKDSCRIKCGDGSGQPSDRMFSMIAVGLRK